MNFDFVMQLSTSYLYGHNEPSDHICSNEFSDETLWAINH